MTLLMTLLSVCYRKISSVSGRSVAAASVLLLSMLASPVFAAPEAAAGLQLKTDAFREVEVTGKGGKKEKQLQALTRALPGQEVIYVITYRNTGTKPAEKVVVNNPVPKGLAYQSGSAQGNGTLAEVSVDGGKQYGQLEALRITGADGKPRAAKAEDVTHVRWTVAAAVKPGSEGKVTYRALLK